MRSRFLGGRNFINSITVRGCHRTTDQVFWLRKRQSSFRLFLFFFQRIIKMPQDLPSGTIKKQESGGGGTYFTDSMLIQTTTCLITRKQFPLKNLSSVVGSPQRRGSRRTTKQSVSNSHCSAAPVFAAPSLAYDWLPWDELQNSLRFHPPFCRQGFCLRCFWSAGYKTVLVSCRRKESLLLPALQTAVCVQSH